MRTAAVALLSIVLALGIPAEEVPNPAADFDYLLGDWEFTAVSKQWGAFRGRWSAVKLADGQILDEYRVLDGDGKTVYVTTTLRNYNEAKKVWDLVGADPGGGLRDFGTARRSGAEMHIEQTFGASGDRPSLWRIRYHNIRPGAFSWAGDRSEDGGKSWTKDFLKIEARRVGPRRVLPSLTGFPDR
jgi:hypothetical protein